MRNETRGKWKRRLLAGLGAILLAGAAGAEDLIIEE